MTVAVSKVRVARAISSMLVAAGLVASTSSARAADVFDVTSPAFKDGDLWPSKYAGSDPSRTNPPCPGQNVSPPLAWSNVPANAKSLAVLMYDVDGGNGVGSVHWVGYDIPTTRTSFAEGEASAAPKGWVGGKNSIGSDHYFGPC